MIAAPTYVGGRFRKGVSGNPGGRPKGIRDLVRRKTRDGRACVNLLTSIMNDENETTRNRLAACEMLLNRGFGRTACDPHQGEQAEEERASLAALRAIIDSANTGQRPKAYDV